MSKAQEYVDISEMAVRLNREAAELRGSLGNIMVELRQEFNVKTITQAVTKLKKMRKRLGRMQREYNEQMQQFEKKWGHLFEKIL